MKIPKPIHESLLCIVRLSEKMDVAIIPELGRCIMEVPVPNIDGSTIHELIRSYTRAHQLKER